MSHSKAEDIDEKAEDFQPQENEYEAQFFRFTPKSMIDSLYNALFDSLLEQKLPELKSKVLSNYAAAFSKEEIEEIFRSIESEMARGLNSRFTALEEYALENVFAIPPYVCLPEDEIHMDPRLDGVDKAALDAEIQELEKRADKALFMNEHMVEELRLIETVGDIQKKSLERLQNSLEVGKDLGQERHMKEQRMKMLLALLENNDCDIDEDEELDE